MKRTLLILTLGVALAGLSFAQSGDSTNAPPPPGPPPGGHFPMLTSDEQQELEAAHKAAIQADPSLETEGKDIMEKMKAAHESGEKPSQDLIAQAHAFRKKLDEAMIKADPKVAPIIAKIEAAHAHRGGPGGPPPPPPPPGQ